MTIIIFLKLIKKKRLFALKTIDQKISSLAS